MAEAMGSAHPARACIRCGATSTPLWRPEVLAGPKVLCNACGVRVLYPVKSKRAKPDSDFTTAADHQSHSGKSAKGMCQRSASLPNSDQSRSQCAKGQDSSRMSMPESSKRQKRRPAADADVRLSPAQKQYMEVERHHDMTGRRIIRWIITDCTIDDTRDFDHVMHAQSFIDECWAFISADFRDKASVQRSLAAKDDLELLLAAAAHVPQQTDEGSLAGMHDGRLHEAAAAADQIKLSVEPGPSAQVPNPPSNSPPGQAAALETAAEAVHEAGAERQLMSPRQCHSSVADVCVPTDQSSCPGLPKQVESAVLASSPPQPAPPKPAHPQTANPHSAPALWPRHSKQMANVTALHGGGKKSGQKHPPQAAPPAGFAVKSSPTAPVSGSLLGVAGTSSRHEGLTKPLQVRQSLDEPAQRPIDLSRVGQSASAAAGEPAAGSSSMPSARRSHSSSKPELPTYQASPARSVSISALHLPPSNSQDPCTAQALPQVTHAVDDRLQRQEAHAQFGADNHLCTAQMGFVQKEELPNSAAAVDLGTASQPGSARHYRQAEQAVSAGCWHGSGGDHVRDVSVCSPSQHMPISWGVRKPRTQHQGSRQFDGSMTDLAVVAAAATAEAEQAAASAMARAHIDFDESARQSDAQQRHNQHHPHNPQRNLHQTRQGLRSHSFSPNSGPAPQQQPCSSASRGHHDADPEPLLPAPRQGGGRKGGGPRTGRNHHRAGASPSNLHKDLGYIGSNFLGVNGVRHGLEFPLRWKAGTWDPVVKKTVYIGSFDTEVAAAKAVDAWHASCGRPPVNFVQPEPQPAGGNSTRTAKQQRQGKGCATSGSQGQRACLAWPPANESSCDEDPYCMGLKSSDGYCMSKPKRRASVDAQQAEPLEAAQHVGAEAFASALYAATPAADSSNETEPAPAPAAFQSLSLLAATEGRGIDGSHQSGLALDLPQNRSAGALAATALEWSPEAAAAMDSREGVQAESMAESRGARNCRGILFDDGKWRAQIKIEGNMQFLGCFDNKEDAAQAYALARRQKLLMHVS